LPPAGAQDALTQLGPMARQVEDLSLILPIIAGMDWRDPAIIPMPLGAPEQVDLKTLRVAMHTDNGIVSPTRETVETVQAAAAALADAGMAVTAARPAGIEQTFDLFFGLLAADGGAGIHMLLQRYGTTAPSPSVQSLLELVGANPMSAAQFGGLMVQWDMFRSTMLSFMEGYDVILCPACAFPAPPHGYSYSVEGLRGYSYTQTYNLTGWPGAVVRAGTSPEGLPIGVQMVARPWREDVALAVAQHLESTFGGWKAPSV
jgi:amidase